MARRAVTACRGPERVALWAATVGPTLCKGARECAITCNAQRLDGHQRAAACCNVRCCCRHLSVRVEEERAAAAVAAGIVRDRKHLFEKSGRLTEGLLHRCMPKRHTASKPNGRTLLRSGAVWAFHRRTFHQRAEVYAHCGPAQFGPDRVHRLPAAWLQRGCSVSMQCTAGWLQPTSCRVQSHRRASPIQSAALGTRLTSTPVVRG
jgi:hypothetical protein